MSCPMCIDERWLGTCPHNRTTFGVSLKITPSAEIHRKIEEESKNEDQAFPEYVDSFEEAAQIERKGFKRGAEFVLSLAAELNSGEGKEQNSVIHKEQECAVIDTKQNPVYDCDGSSCKKCGPMNCTCKPVDQSLDEAAMDYAKVKYEGKSAIGYDMYSAESPYLLEVREIKMNAFKAGAAHQAPISRAEGWREAIIFLDNPRWGDSSEYLKQEVIRLGILPGDKKEGGV